MAMPWKRWANIAAAAFGSALLLLQQIHELLHFEICMFTTSPASALLQQYRTNNSNRFATDGISSQKAVPPPQPALLLAICVRHYSAPVPPAISVLSFVYGAIRPLVLASSILFVVPPLSRSHISVRIAADPWTMALVIPLFYVPFIRPSLAVDDKALQLREEGGLGLGFDHV
jgi:hypothetical protein